MWEEVYTLRARMASRRAHILFKLEELTGCAELSPFILENDAEYISTLLLFSIRRASFSRCSTFSAS